MARSLVHQLKEGNHQAFLLLYEEYKPHLYRFIKSTLSTANSPSVSAAQESQDLVQTIFLRVWERREEINPELNFKSYLFTIAKNLVYDTLRSKYFRILTIETEGTLSQSRESDAHIREGGASLTPHMAQKDFSDSIIAEDFRAHFNSLIAKIPPQRRKIFLMSRVKNMTYKEIAQELNISENTVDTQIRNALNFLRKNIHKLFIILLCIHK